jgi:Mg2+-importing ATPase
MPPGGDPSAGLTSGQAAERLRLDGPNALGGEGRRTNLKILASQFASPLVLILVVASCVSIVVGDNVEAGIILAIVAMSAGLGFVQEARAEASVAALQARLTLRATVVRDGLQQEVPVHDVVRGDVVALAAGDIVPADGRLLDANHLYVDESSLTGESAAALKAPRDGEPDPARDADRDAFVFLGTSVVSGTGRALITATGARTSYGAIAKRLAERAPQTDFQLGVRAFGMLVARVTLLLVVGVFAVNVALQRPLFESLLFAVALAVGLTPELLPAIVTLNLTRGARALAVHGVLVKRLPAIQNLGGVTVLCTDKTGTLTEGKLRLERSVGIDRDDATEAATALALAYLNSHFQAGFANPLDTAILAQATAPADLASYRKLGELPYDFQRRLLSVVVQRADEPPLVVTKGAPESVVVRSTSVREDHTARPIDAAEHARLATLVDGASADGFRLVGVASRVLSAEELASLTAPGSSVGLASADQLERDLTFEGVILFSDPAKAGVGATIADLERQGVALKVVTGDNELVARHTAGEVGLEVAGILTGDEIRKLTHPALVARAPGTTIFARVDPDQKLQVIRALRESGAVVGYLGDGINDAPALHVADVGISVDNATDVARSAADIILLEPSLAAISQGVTEGRRTFANTLKYIRMGTSSNFGNMLSMAGAALRRGRPGGGGAAGPLGHPRRGALHGRVRPDLVHLRLRHVRAAAPGPRAERAGIPHRLVHRVAVHPDPGRARDPHAAQPVLAQPAQPRAGRGNRRGPCGGRRDPRQPARRPPRVRRPAAALLGPAGRDRGRVSHARGGRQAIHRGLAGGPRVGIAGVRLAPDGPPPVSGRPPAVWPAPGFGATRLHQTHDHDDRRGPGLVRASKSVVRCTNSIRGRAHCPSRAVPGARRSPGPAGSCIPCMLVPRLCAGCRDPTHPDAFMRRVHRRDARGSAERAAPAD